jgi:putative tryptophan/tyrosine transport system substrate-binding protein
MRQMIELENAARSALVRTRELQFRVGFLVLGLIPGERSFQIFQRKCQLIVANALGFAAEVCAADLCKNVLELGIARGELLKRVGVLASQVPCPLQPDNLVVRRLTELGWIEGRTFVFECVSTVGRLDELPELARELVSRQPDVLIAAPDTFVMALKQETTTIAIVMLSGWEPMQLGLVTSFARPEGNITGVAWFGLFAKQMELLKEIVPNLRRVAHIQGANPPLPPEVIKVVNEYISSVASTLGFTWQVFQPAAANDYDEIFARLVAEHFDAAYIPSSPFNLQNRTRIDQLALRYRIPAVSESAGWARVGLLLAYGQDATWSAARGMEYVDKILRGAKPSDLPVEQATKFELVINLKTAKALGLTVPPSLLARADVVIE